MTVHAISTGKMLGGAGAGYNPRWFYVSQNGGAWEPTYTGWGNEATAEGRLMNLRHIQAIFADETGYPSAFDPQTNTDDYIAQLATYRQYGMLAATIGLQGGWPDYNATDGDISAFNDNGTANYGTGNAVNPQAGTWWYRLKQVIEAMDDLGMFCILNVFYFRQDGHLTGNEACREAVRSTCQFLIANNYRNVLFDLVNEFGDGNYNHSILTTNSLTNGVAELVVIAQDEFNGEGWQPPVGVSMPGLWTAGGDLLTVSDIILPHGNNATISDIGTRMSYYYNTYDMPVIMNEDHPGGSYTYGLTLTQTAFDREVDSMNACWNANGSWGGMLYGYFQAFPFRWELGATADITTEANYVRGIFEELSTLTGTAPAIDPPVEPTVYYSPYSNIDSASTLPEMTYSQYSNVDSATTLPAATEITVTTTIQAAHDIANPGDTIIIPAGTYTEAVTVTKTLTFQGQAGAIIDAEDTRARWFDVRADDVTITGLTMQDCVSEDYWGGIVIGYAGINHRLIVSDCVLDNAGYAAIATKLGNDHQILRNTVTNSGTVGIRIDSGEGHIIRHNICTGQGSLGTPVGYAQGSESGGMKLQGNYAANGDGATHDGVTGYLNNVLVEYNQCYDNHGPGIWFDVNSGQAGDPNTIRYNRVWDNGAQGIVYELSQNGKIYENDVVFNGSDYSQASNAFGWGCGILIQNSDTTEVFHNRVAWNEDGIIIIDQDRTPWENVEGNYIHDNIVAIVESTTTSPIYYAAGFMSDFEGDINLETHDNIYNYNQYFFQTATTPNAEPGDQWGPPHRWKINWDWFGPNRVADWNSWGSEGYESYIGQTELQAILTEYELPTTPAGSSPTVKALVWNNMDVQVSRPDGTISAGNWTVTGAASLHEALDGVEIDSGIYIQSPSNPVDEACEVSLADLDIPQNRNNHIIHYVFSREGATEINLLVELVEGSTVRASTLYENVSEFEHTGSFELTNTEASNITDYTNLRIRFTADVP